jgi:hypothetical protein
MLERLLRVFAEARAAVEERLRRHEQSG